MMKIHELYREDDLVLLRKKVKNLTIAAAVLAAAALGVCVYLCTRVNTANAALLERWVIGISVLSGWTEITLLRFVLGDTRREITHAGMLRTASRQRYAGQVEVTGEKLRIVNSIPFRTVLLTDGEEKKRLRVIENRAAVLEKAAPRAVYVANGYIAGWEEEA